MSEPPHPPSTLLRIPVELRYKIYECLCSDGPISYPFKHSPVTSISHGAPPFQLLLACRQISNEVLRYFYRISTLRYFCVETPIPRLPREHVNPEALAAIRQARKAEIILVWNLSKCRMASQFPAQSHRMADWLQDLAKLLLDEAHGLEVVTISVHRVVSHSLGSWTTYKRTLEPLQDLKSKVRFELGKVFINAGLYQEVALGLKDYMTFLNSS